MNPKILRLLPAFAFTACLGGCASMGTPDGGPYDETPPRMVSSVPVLNATNWEKKKISILFDEYIKLEGANEKVVVSPPQQEAPNIRADGKRIKIDFFDSLQANTTYTIDFGDAIVDNNEGNPMGLFSYSFATGNHVDTLEVSGHVLNAENLEPIKGIYVGLHTDPSDTAFTTKPLTRVSRTNSLGRFTIKGIAPGRYRLYALQDADGNYTFNQKSEVIAFDTLLIEPTCAPDVRYDTLWRDSIHYDSIVAVPYTHYYPDNVVLRAFLEEGQDRHLLKTERKVPTQFTLYFTAPNDTLPQIRGLNFDAEDAFVVEPSAHFDTITYWIPDTTIAYLDTLSIDLTYMDTDTLGVLQERTEPLDLAARTTRAKQLQDEARAKEEWEKKQRKKRRRNKDGEAKEVPYPRQQHFVTYTVRPSGNLAPNQNITFEFSEPVEKIDTAGLHFHRKVDTTWVEAPYLFLPVKNKLRQYRLFAEWRPKETYRFEIDSAAFHSVMGSPVQGGHQTFRVRPNDEFSSLFIQLHLKDTGAVVQLLNRGDKVVRSARANAKGQADFFYLKPDTYYLRLFIDRNGNNRWDTGDFRAGQQPEEVFYFPKPLTLRAKWEVDQEWDVRGIDLTRQKPKEITKQKPDREKKIRSRNAEREREQGRR